MHALSTKVRTARAFVKTPGFTKLWRYGVVSVVSTAITLSALYLFFHVMKIGSAMESNVLATAIATIPSYYLNRTWAWGKRGKSHVWREVLPFWITAIASLVLSTVAVGVADHVARHLSASDNVVTVVVELANFCTYGVLWIAKFVLFNRVLFVHPGRVAPGAEATETLEAVRAR